MNLKITTDLPGGDIDLLTGAVTDRFSGAEAVRLMQAGYAVVATDEEVAAAAAAADTHAAAAAAPRERRSRRSSPADQAEPGSAAQPPATPDETLSEG